jgi:hypothetical protein
MEHHEDAFFGAAFPRIRRRRRAPTLPCPQCGRRFRTQADLELHRFDGHTFSRPLLLLRGRECGRSRLTVTEPTTSQDWEAFDCQTMTINGHESEPSKAGALLSTFDDAVVSVVLAGDRTEQTFDLRFAIADLSDLDGVDGRLREMVRGHQLTIAAIEGFLAATEQFRTAGNYTAGIATYLYGVLAREQSPESGLEHDAYRGRFDEAVSLLGGFDRDSADAICGLVAFHYNQFELATLRTGSPRVAWASRRMLRLLRGDDLEDEEVEAPARWSLDFVLSDAITEQVLTWSCIPLDGSADATVEEIESSLPSQEPFDQLKLRIVVAEHYLRAGATDLGRRHVAELRHNQIAETWARRHLARSREWKQQ